MELSVKVVSGGSETLSVRANGGPQTSVLMLKQLIEQQNPLRFPVAAQRLIFQGQILQNEKLLTEYNITTGMALHLTLTPGVAAAAAASASPFAMQAPSVSASATASAQLRSYLQQMRSDPGYTTAMQTLQKICENIVGHPTEEKYRKLRVGNAALKARLFDRIRGMDCITLLGFTSCVEEGHVVLVPTAEKWENLVVLKRVLDEYAAAPPAQAPSAAFANMPGFGFSNANANPSPPATQPYMSNMAAQAQAMLQNPMMAQMLQNNPMVQQMAQANPMVAQAMQNPAMLSQMLGSVQQNPMMMQQITQMMQDPNAMQQMQQMMRGAGGPSAAFASPPAPGTINPFASAAAATATNPFAAQSTPAAPTASFASPAYPVAPQAPSLVAAAAAPQSVGGGDEIFDEDEIAQAIARSLEEA